LDADLSGKTGGGILPLGGACKETSGYKGYGFGMICEICTGILSGGLTSKNGTPERTKFLSEKVA